MNFLRDKGAKTKLRRLSLETLVNLSLREGGRSINNGAVGGLEIIVCIAYGLDGGGVGEFVIKVPENNINALIMHINVCTSLKYVLGGLVCSSNFGSHRHKGKVSGLRRHTNLSDSLKEGWGDGIPRSSA